MPGANCHCSRTNSEFNEIHPTLTVLPVLPETIPARHILKACTYGDLLFAAPILDFPASAIRFVLEVGIYVRSLGLSSRRPIASRDFLFALPLSFSGRM
jgi:hypothetical protein